MHASCDRRADALPSPARQLGTALVCVQEVDPSEFGVGALAANFDEEVPTMEGEGTRRLALLDMDWEHVRAVDILMVLRSFLVEVGCPVAQHKSPIAQDFTLESTCPPSCPRWAAQLPKASGFGPLTSSWPCPPSWARFCEVFTARCLVAKRPMHPCNKSPSQ